MDMTVDQLIAKLKEASEAGYGDHPVAFSYNYGDHWHTEVSKPISDLGLQHIVYSPYHNMDKVLDQETFDRVVDEHPNSDYDPDEIETGLEYQGKPVHCVVMLQS